MFNTKDKKISLTTRAVNLLLCLLIIVAAAGPYDEINTIVIYQG